MTNRRTLLASEARITRGCPRRAFSLVELMVVVAIIGILVALLLPAVQAAREAARRASCSNNLVQLVMAVHQYEATHQVYPPGTVNATGPILNQAKGYHHGWIEQILPFLEKEAVYHHVDRDLGVYHKVNRPVRKIGFSALVCASNPQSGTGYSHYAAVHHDVEASIDSDQNGVFFLNSAVTQDDVSDGVGYTIFLGEKALEPGDLGWLSGTRAILRNTGEPINTATDYVMKTRAWNTIPDYPLGTSKSPVVMDGMGGMMSGFEVEEFVTEEEEAIDREIDVESILDAQGLSTPRTVATFVGGFSSYHTGGANFAMGDGSTRFLVNTMSVPVYRQLGHRADGELVELE